MAVAVPAVRVAVGVVPAAGVLVLFLGGFSTTAESVVSTMAAIDAALPSAALVTLTGSMTPCAARSP